MGTLVRQDGEQPMGGALPPPRVMQRSGWRLQLTVQGDSMVPWLQSGDVVMIRCLPSEDIRLGDLVCFQRDGVTILHRVVAQRGRGQPALYEKGDADNGGQWIEADCIIGRAELINGQPPVRSYRQALWWGRIERSTLWVWRRLGWGAVPQSVSSRWRRWKLWMLTRRKQRSKS